MLRKLLVRIIACSYLAQGLRAIGTFFSPILASQKPVALELSAILSGVFGLSAGFYLFKLEENGRTFAIALLFLRVAYNLAFIVWMFFQEGLAAGLTFFGRPLFEAKSIYPFAIYLTAWAGIALAASLFLMQKDTKAIFVSETTTEPSSKPVTKTI